MASEEVPDSIHEVNMTAKSPDETMAETNSPKAWSSTVTSSDKETQLTTEKPEVAYI